MPRPWKEIGRYGSVGIELVLTVLILAGLGTWLDGRYWGGRGWGTAAGFLVGVIIGFRNLFRTAARMQRDIERAESSDPKAPRWTVDESWLHDSARDEHRPNQPEPRADRPRDPPEAARGSKPPR